MRTSALTLWIILFCVIKHTELSDIDAKITYAEFGTGLNLSCNCLSINARNQIKRWYDDNGLIKGTDDDWGPKLFNGGEKLEVQSVRNLNKNITYECRAVGQNESEEVCQKYIVQAFKCRPNKESIEPENRTHLEIGDSALFTCKQYFACDKVNEVKSVSMRTEAKNSKVIPCTVSDHGLTHECKLQIVNISEDDFDKAVQCVVNDSGIISVYEAFLFKKEICVREDLRQPTEIIVSIVVILSVIILVALLWRCVFLNQKCKSKYKYLSPLDCFNSDYKKNPQILVYSVLEEENLLSTRLSSLNDLLQDFEYKTFDKDIKEGENIIGAFSDLANESLALIIVVDVCLLKNEEYKNKFSNVLKSDAVTGKCRIRPYYISVLYNHENSCECQSGIKCHKKTGLEKKFVSFDLTDNQKVITEKLKKRLPPNPASESRHTFNSKVTRNGNYKSCMSSDYSVNMVSNSYSDYSRMESYMSCNSDTPLFI